MDTEIRNAASGPGDILPVTTHSPEETWNVGRMVADGLEPGDLVALYGNLGAGKTVFVRGLCAGLGLDAGEVTSPTFTIVHEYHDANLPIYHFDAYRIERVAEFYELGYEEYFFGDGVTIVEWADRIEPLLPVDAVRIRIAHAGGDKRRIGRIAADQSGREVMP